ncbi:MAG TPA: nucleoside hydrolase [Clostridia bacterium]|nr:nucleoside hydrolase [Clostridia bacterium]
MRDRTQETAGKLESPKKIPVRKSPFKARGPDTLRSTCASEQAKIPIWFDCDTGVDDAIALLLLRQLNCFDLVGVSTVAGNVELEKTTRNTLCVLELTGAKAPVYRGASQPLIRDQIMAPEVHGKNGLGDVDLPQPSKQLEKKNAWDALYDAALAHAGELVLIAVGPMTNIGLALAKYKELPSLLKRVVIMGGAAVGGNTTPSAEFNILVDPEAADILFNCGLAVTMCGLDMTLKAYLTTEELDELGNLGSPQAVFARDCLQNALRYSLSLGQPGISLHDPAAVLYTADDSIFESFPAWIRVETKGGITYGKTVTDLYSDKKMPERKHIVVTDVDREAFKARIFSLMEKYGS